MFKKHVIRTFKTQWLKLILVGLMIILSSFIYMVVGAAVNAIHEGAEPFLNRTNQEDFMIELTPYVTESELQQFSDSCLFDSIFLETIYETDQSCYDLIVQSRFNQINEALDGVSLEIRQYKETHFTFNNERHKIRILKDASSINLSEIDEGRFPTEPNEIALTRNYVKNQGLTLGDEITILNQTYTIVGYVLFPDYNLPIIEHMLMFDSVFQTLGLLSSDAFNTFERPIHSYISGVFTEDNGDLDAQIIALKTEYAFLTTMILTENNVRSGAIYAELEGGQATGLFLSGFIALIGIFIITIMISKTIEKERGAIGVFKALGLKTSEMLKPYLVFIAIYTLVFLCIGFILGYLVSPVFRDLYLEFYLLPSVEPAFSWTDFFIAILVPFVIIFSLGTYRLLKIMGEGSIQLLSPKIYIPKKVRFKHIRRIISKLNIRVRLQISLMLRQFSKVVTYTIAVFFAIFLIFLSLSMVDVFNLSINSYYDQTEFKSIGYCQDYQTCDASSHDKVIEMAANISGNQVTVIGIELSNQTHPLFDQRSNDITNKLSEGIIISKSYQDMYGVKLGDLLIIQVADKSLEREVVAVSNILLGAYVFIQREDLAENIFDDSDYFNALYSVDKLNDDDYPLVIHVEDILTQIGYTNDLMEAMFFIMFIVAVLIAVIVIYLLTSLSIEDQTYEISLFSVLGYTKKEITQILLSGYFKLNVVIFIIAIPYTILVNYLFKIIMIDLFDYYMPLTLKPLHILMAGGVSLAVFMVSSLHAKSKIEKRSLQESLKIYQL
jgi:putative ABC transport system permease protein